MAANDLAQSQERGNSIPYRGEFERLSHTYLLSMHAQAGMCAINHAIYTLCMYAHAYKCMIIARVTAEHACSSGHVSDNHATYMCASMRII